MKRICKLFLIVVIGTVLCLTLFACNKDEGEPESTIDLSTYYCSNQVLTEYSTARELITLPENVVLQNRSLTASSATTSAQNYPAYRTNKICYIEGYDGFVLTNSEYSNASSSTVSAGRYHGFYKLGDDEVTIPVQYEKIYFAHGVIVVMNGAGEIGVFDTDGNELIACGDSAFGVVGSTSASSSYVLSNYVDVLSPNYIATKYKKFESGATSVSGTYVRVFSLKTGKQVASLSGLETTAVECFDEYMVVKRTTNSKDNYSIVTLDDNCTTPMTLSDVPTSGYGYYEEYTDASTDKLVVNYLGNGKFFILNQLSGTAESHSYCDLDGATYWNCAQFKYNAKTNVRTNYEGNYIFISLVNSYYAEDIELDVNGFLNPGYTFGTYVLSKNENKKTSFDQVILDEDMNICVSLTYTMGYTANEDEIEAGVFDIAMTFTGDYATAVEPQGVVRVYDKQGNVVLSKTGDYCYAHISGDNIIVGAIDVNSSSDTVKYGIIDFDGKTILPAEYNFISDFTAGYALAIKYTTSTDISTYTFDVVDKRGNKLADTSYISDSIALTSDGTPIYVNGAYAYKVTVTVDSTDTSYYGLRNFAQDTTQAQIFEDLYSKITVVRSDLNSVNDVNYQHPLKLFAFTQASSTSPWTISEIA